MDVFPHPSLRDGLPNALLEAMACKKPVIATPVSGMLDMLKDGENGRIVPVNDVDALTMVFQEILSDKNLQRHLGGLARQTAQSGFTLQNELDGSLTLYRKLGLNI